MGLPHLRQPLFHKFRHLSYTVVKREVAYEDRHLQITWNRLLDFA